MPEQVNAKLVDSTCLAKLFSISSRRVQQLAQEKIIASTKVKGVYKYDVVLVTQQYVKYLSDKLAGRGEKSRSSELEYQKLDAEIALKQAKARVAELELKELEGEMHRAKDVEDMTDDLVLAVRSALLAMPGRLAVDLADIKNASEISECIKIEVYNVLEDLSKYQYSPEEYRRRVRERQGWLERYDEDDE